MTIREWVRANKGKYQSWAEAVQMCVKETKTSRNRVKRVFREESKKGSFSKDLPSSGRSVGVSVNEFLSNFDYEKILEGAIDRLCQDRFLVESDLRVASGIPNSIFRRVADSPQFADRWLRVDGKTWWSTDQNVRNARDKQKLWR